MTNRAGTRLRLDETVPSGFSFQSLLARLHLHAVLPALEDLVKLSPEARALAEGWDFSLRLRLGGQHGATATLVSPGDGSLTVHPHADVPARLTLRFLSAAQVNRTFLNRPALPPLPTAGFWNVARVTPFTKLAKLLDDALQPAPGVLERDPAYRERHVRLLFRVLLGAIPVLAEGDPVSRHTLGHTPDGTAEIRAPSLGLVGWARWTRGRMTGGPGNPPGGAPPDVVITFADRATADAALLGSLDPNAAVGLGKVEVRGLVPLADGLSVAMDRVEYYLKPVASGSMPSVSFTASPA